MRDLVIVYAGRFVPLIRDTVREFRPLIPTVMRPPEGDLNFYGGKNLEHAWPGLTPEALREEMVDYALSALGRRLHAVGV